MANRAYLYSDDRDDAWDAPEEGYYDSRDSIPLAWFYFFLPEDVRLIDVESNNLQWQEVRLSTEKGPALVLFERRRPLLMSLIGHRVDEDAVDRFVAIVGRRPGRFLLMDPNSVLGGIGFDFADDQEHARNITTILAEIGEGNGPPDAAREATRPYVGEFTPDPDRCECQILGFTYGRDEIASLLLGLEPATVPARSRVGRDGEDLQSDPFVSFRPTSIIIGVGRDGKICDATVSLARRGCLEGPSASAHD